MVITSVLDGGSVEDKSIVTGKVFEAIGLGTPILAVAPSGSDIEAVLKTSTLARRCSGSDVTGMAKFLREAMTQSSHGRNEQTTYAWSTLAEKLDGVLRTAMSSTLN